VDLIGSSVADVLVEATPLEPGGTAAIGHAEAALHHGLDVVCLNKGPVAWDYRRLAALADDQGRQFRFEGIVMDGCPTFSLVAGSLPVVRVSGFCGVLNSTSNVVLDHLADGGELADAVRHAQQQGFAEADPQHDLSGYDTAVKVAALANVWLDADVDPDTISCTGVDESLAEAARSAHAGGRRLRLLGSAARHDDHVDASVDLVAVEPTSPFFATAGPSSTLQIVTDLAGVIEVTERAPGLTQTAYAVLADLLHCAVEPRPGGPQT
jgi:homoserine dehydrogenase